MTLPKRADPPLPITYTSIRTDTQSASSVHFLYGANCWLDWQMNPADHTTTYTRTQEATKMDNQGTGKEVQAILFSSNTTLNLLS